MNLCPALLWKGRILSETVEKVAEAIMKARHPGAPLTYVDFVLTVSLGSDPAALEAMREPTEEMVKAGVEGWRANSYASIQWVWPSMVDAALGIRDGNPSAKTGTGRVRSRPARWQPCRDALPHLSHCSGWERDGQDRMGATAAKIPHLLL